MFASGIYFSFLFLSHPISYCPLLLAPLPLSCFPLHHHPANIRRVVVQLGVHDDIDLSIPVADLHLLIGLPLHGLSAGVE